MAISTRSRDIEFYFPGAMWWREIRDRFGYSKTVFASKPPNSSPQDKAIYWGKQTTVSENHPGFRRALKEHSGADYGGNFTMQKTWTEPSSFSVGSMNSGWAVAPLGGSGSSDPNALYRYSYTGPTYMNLRGFSGVDPAVHPTTVRTDDNGLNVLGTKAVSLCAPTNPVANLGTSLLETLRDGFPQVVSHTLWESKLSSIRDVFRSGGDEYLNIEFGWAPLVSDIKDFVYGVRNLNKLVNQYVRDSGKNVRRRYSFAPVVSTTESTFRTNQSTFGSPDSCLYMTQGGKREGTIIKSSYAYRRAWFSGAFTYHLPASFFGGWGAVSWLDQAIHMLGLDLTPETLWDLVPWSWAADWFGNFGDVIHNLDAYSQNGLVMRYGYIMEHTIARDTYTYVGDPGYRPDIKGGLLPSPVTLCCETKVRRQASPFGFGISLGSLTPQQQAIIAALGISHA